MLGTEFLPISRAEMTARGWDRPDFVYVTGDAYVDHPSFGVAIISRVLEAAGYRVVGYFMESKIKDCIQNTLNPLGVEVVIEARHLCMSMRGVQKQNSLTTTSDFTGAFLKNKETREEFMHLIGVKLS